MRQNALIFTIIFILILLLGCSKTNSDLLETKNQADEHVIKTKMTDDGLILPEIDAGESAELSFSLLSDTTAFRAFNATDKFLYGSEEIRKKDVLESVVKVRNISSGKYSVVEYPEEVKNWTVASGSSVIMQGRYKYEWLCANDTNGLYMVYLTKLDFQTGTMEIEDKVIQTSPFIYLCKLNNNKFISYSNYQTKSEATPYAVVSYLAVYNVDGLKKEILNVEYENSESWKDSRGVLVEHFFCDNEKIYGLVHGKSNDKEFYKLCSFDNEGKIKTEKKLVGFDKIIGKTYLVEMEKRGDYLAFRMYDGLKNCICRIENDGTVKIVMKESDNAQCRFAVADDYIFFCQSNVDPNTDKVVQKPCPVYYIDVRNDRIGKANVDIPVKEAYFSDISVFDNQSLVLTYCENGAFNPQKVFQFFADKETILTLGEKK